MDETVDAHEMRTVKLAIIQTRLSGKVGFVDWNMTKSDRDE